MAGTPPARAQAHTFKLVILGDAGVGKTALAVQFVKGTFSEYTESTIGASFLNQTVKLSDGQLVRFQIWDTAGQERFHSLAPMYYRGAQAAIVVYDMTNAATFERAQDWVTELQAQGDSNVEVCLVGNKCDMEDERQTTADEGQAFASSAGLSFLEASAKTGENVAAMFTLLAQKLAARAPAAPPRLDATAGMRTLDDPHPGAGSGGGAKKGGCCG